ncbi:inositol phosphophingolipids phospholipase C [Blakeslea trispora]|nr:inositol phosphophingolipids phospholipase C [Blakeslea trispora]
MSTTGQLKVLSYNCWGLAIVSKDRELRLKAIAEALQTQDCDLITLQEVWVAKDFERIEHAVKSRLPYSKYFPSGALGSGLAIFSKFPILSHHYYRYTLNGHPLMFIHGDYYVGKGVGSIVVQHPIIGLLEVFNTHLHASYSPMHQYTAHRAAECWQLATILRNSAAMGRQIIMSGDFNSIPSSFNYRLICDHGMMTDSWLQTHGEPDPSKFDFDNYHSEAYTQYFGFTCSSPFNTFSRHYNKGKISLASEMKGKRLDYIFYRRTLQLECIQSSVTLTDTIEHTGQSYSDHFGVMSVFRLSSGNDRSGLSQNPCYTDLSPSVLCDILEELKREQDHCKKSSTRLIYLCCLCVILQSVLYVLVVALPSSLREQGILPIALVTAVGGMLMNIVSVLIPICLIVGFVFGHTEQRAFDQLIDEMDTLRHQVLIANCVLTE